MSEQYPTAVKPTDIPHVKPVDDFPARTIEDVQREMTLAAQLLIAHRSRQGHTKNVRECNEGKPALLVQEVEWLQEEWRLMWDAARD